MQSIKTFIHEYLKAFPEERPRLNQLLELLKHAKDEDDLLSRSNVVGHITAGAIVICRTTKKVLRIYHKNYRLPLLPGGHFEIGEKSPLNVAIRKIQ
jgi:hypothetical protein